MRLSPLLLVCLLAGQSQDESPAKKVVPEIRRMEEVRFSPSTEARKTFKARTGREAPDGEVLVYKGMVRYDDQNFPIRVATARVDDSTEIGVALYPDDRVIARVVALQEPDGGTLDAFLASFTDLELHEMGIAAEAAVTDGVLKKAKGDATLQAIFDMRQSMAGVRSRFVAASNKIRKRQPGVDEEVAALKREFEAMAAAAEKIAFLDDAAKQKLTRFSSTALKRTEELAAALGGTAAEKRQAVQAVSRQGCRDCHQALKKVFKQQRAEIGIGDGVLRPGVDLFVQAQPAPATQARIAAKVRELVLLMLEAP